MRCSGCGKELKPKMKSCPNCGRLVTTSVGERLYSKGSKTYSGVLHQQGRVMVDQDYNEEIKVGTERREVTKGSRVTQSIEGRKLIRIVEGSAVIDSNGITFSLSSGVIPVGDFALSFDEPEERIIATAIGSKISPDISRNFVYLEVWEDTVSSIEDSDLITVNVEGSDTSAQFHVGFRCVPATGKIKTNDDFANFLKSQRKTHTHRHLVPIAIVEATKRGPIKVTHYASSSADILKPRSTISVKGLGSKMEGSYHVATIRHKMGASDESEFSQRIQCEYCGTENDKNDKFCKNCGSRITS